MTPFFILSILTCIENYFHPYHKMRHFYTFCAILSKPLLIIIFWCFSKTLFVPFWKTIYLILTLYKILFIRLSKTRSNIPSIYILVWFLGSNYKIKLSFIVQPNVFVPVNHFLVNFLKIKRSLCHLMFLSWSIISSQFPLLILSMKT